MTARANESRAEHAVDHFRVYYASRVVAVERLCRVQVEGEPHVVERRETHILKPTPCEVVPGNL
eukprot:6693515-Prymnesium_polylepis.1